MKLAGLRNALLFFVGGLITWGLLIWLPRRELGRLSGYLGRPENLPPTSRTVFGIHEAIYPNRWLILALFVILSIGYYYFYIWAAKGPRWRMLLHNIALFIILAMLYGFLIYNVVGIRVALRGIAG